ncbi:MAG: hypothetical protein ISR96_06090 [Nitrospira sp.]|nr:hypothetical protein [bacterium]MBL7049067.1 hypothetical protein [Nitrospira sp.]
MKRSQKTVSYKKHHERKRDIAGLKVIGIDPAIYSSLLFESLEKLI